MVQAAVPTVPADDRRKQKLQLLAEAIDEAEMFAQKRTIASELTEIRRIRFWCWDRSSYAPAPGTR
jgi:predicted transcriptional regulator